MMVYCRDRSLALPRKKGRYIKRKPPVKGYSDRRERYVPEQQQFPSVFMRRSAGGKWLSKDDDDANSILEALING